jgi:hypothetical protein
MRLQDMRRQSVVQAVQEVVVFDMFAAGEQFKSIC